MSERDDRNITASRSELAARAASQEQRNKPRGVIIVGVLVLLAGLIYLMIGRSALAGAQIDRRRELNAASEVMLQKTRLERHRDRSQTGPDPFQKVPNFTTLAENAAQSVGLTPAPSLTRQEQRNQDDIVEQIYRYDRVTSRDLEALIGWVAQVQAMVPGVEISRLELSPQRTQWQMAITFVKPELAP
jgi:hypothetical protein